MVVSVVHLAKWRKAVLAGDLDPTAKLVALAIGAYMNRAGYAYPSKQTVADGCGLSVRAVDGAVNRIEAAGLLDVQRSTGRSANGYQATIPTPHRDAGLDAPSTPHLTTLQPRTGVRTKRNSKREVKTFRRGAA